MFLIRVSLFEFARKLPKSHGKIPYDGNHPTLQNNRRFPQAVYKKTLQDNIPCVANLLVCKFFFFCCKNLLVNPITHENMFNLILPGVCDSVVSK